VPVGTGPADHPLGDRPGPSAGPRRLPETLQDRVPARDTATSPSRPWRAPEWRVAPSGASPPEHLRGGPWYAVKCPAAKRRLRAVRQGLPARCRAPPRGTAPKSGRLGRRPDGPDGLDGLEHGTRGARLARHGLPAGPGTPLRKRPLGASRRQPHPSERDSPSTRRGSKPSAGKGPGPGGDRSHGRHRAPLHRPRDYCTAGNAFFSSCWNCAENQSPDSGAFASAPDLLLPLRALPP
jgi:hypothetical protein